jgi:hypothetical protein
MACRRRALDSKVGEVTVAKTYRLLKAITNTAVDDGLINLDLAASILEPEVPPEALERGT